MWEDIKYFSPDGKDNFGDPSKMDTILIRTMDEMRAFVGRPFLVHCGYEDRTTGGWHPHGKAVDGHFVGLHPIEMYEIAQRFDAFNGIGVYLWWHWHDDLVGGIHVDTRPISNRFGNDARWGSLIKGEYKPVDIEFLRVAVYYDIPG